MRRISVGFAVLVAACAPRVDVAAEPPSPAGTQRTGAAPADIPGGALERLVDSVFAVALPEEKIPGAAFILVQNGRVVLSKGYGVANVETGEAVSPESTLWRIGSISKVMTALGVVQLADRGSIRLDRDVNEYLRRVEVPMAHREPVTPWHLVTHTAGFDELPGRSAASREVVLPLHEFLASRLVRVREPGRLISYSSYGPALAGALIEDVSNLPYETYLERNLWGPLGMDDTNVHPRGAMPTGYGVSGDSVVSATWEWSHTGPAGMINSTADDMGRFMMMMLGDHPRGRHVLSDAARRSMLARQAATHPQVPGVGLGFQEARVNGREIYEHGGDIDGYATLLVLLPQEGTGFFIATHREGAQARYTLRQTVLDRFFPRDGRGGPDPAGAAPRITGIDLSEFVGEYRWNIFCRTCEAPWMPGAVPVTAEGDSALAFLGQTWVPIGPLLFQTPVGGKRIGFARDSAGAIWQLTIGGTGVLERIRR